MGKYFVLIAAVLVAGRASACDLCSCYCAMDAGKGEKGLFASVAEQHTHYGTMQENGHRVANENAIDGWDVEEDPGAILPDYRGARYQTAHVSLVVTRSLNAW